MFKCDRLISQIHSHRMKYTF